MNRLIAIAAAASALAAATPAFAQRIEITPFAGWETSGSFPLTAPTTDTQALRADSQVTYGLAFDYRLTENVEAEFFWADNPTTYSAQSATTGEFAQAYNTRIDQYQFGGLYLLGDKDNSLRPFLSLSLGFTHDSNNNAAPDRTAFGVGVGGGIKYMASKHVGLRADARWMPTYGSAGVGTFCDYGGGGLDYGYDPYGYGGGCYQDTIHNYLQRFNFTVGVTIRP